MLKWKSASIFCAAALSVAAGLSQPAKAEVVTYTLDFENEAFGGTGGTGTLKLDFATAPTGATTLSGTTLTQDFGSLTETVDGITFTTTRLDVTSISLSGTTLTNIIANTPNGIITLSEPDLLQTPLTYTLGIPGTEFGNIVVTNTVTAVPEPSTWAMIILGFFGVGLTAYRTRGTVRFA
jgi:hypothetical protein